MNPYMYSQYPIEFPSSGGAHSGYSNMDTSAYASPQLYGSAGISPLQPSSQDISGQYSQNIAEIQNANATSKFVPTAAKRWDGEYVNDVEGVVFSSNRKSDEIDLVLEGDSMDTFDVTLSDENNRVFLHIRNTPRSLNSSIERTVNTKIMEKVLEFWIGGLSKTTYKVTMEILLYCLQLIDLKTKTIESILKHFGIKLV